MTPNQLADAKAFLDGWEQIYPVMNRLSFPAVSDRADAFKKAASLINMEANQLLLRVIAHEEARKA